MVSVIIEFISGWLWLYLVWRNLRDSYQEEKLIGYSWMILLVFLVVGRITFGVVNWGVWNERIVDWLLIWQKKGFNYWGGLGAAVITTIWYCKVNNWKIWSFFEDITKIWYLLMGLVLIGELIRGGFNWLTVAYFGVVIIGLVIALMIEGKYRSLVWYKSGKKGFVFFFTNMMGCLLAGVVGIILGEKLIVAGIFSGLCLIFMIGLFILGEVFNSLLVFGQRRNSDKKE